MKLTFLYHPVIDLDQAVTFYRDVLGWDEAWREELGQRFLGCATQTSDVTLAPEIIA